MARITITTAKELCPYHAEKSVVRKHPITESSTKMATTRAKNPNRKMMKTRSEKSRVQKMPVVIANALASMKFARRKRTATHPTTQTTATIHSFFKTTRARNSVSRKIKEPLTSPK